jgi:FkbM family methyltransferase
MTAATRFAQEIANVRRLLPPAEFLRWMGILARQLPAVIRSRSLGIVDDRFGGDFVFRCGARKLQICGGSFGLVREIFGQNCYIKPQELADCRTVVDLGANCGTFSLFVRVNAPSAQLLAIEALPALAERARANLARNQLDTNVRVLSGIVGSADNEWTRSLEREHGAVKRLDGPAIVHGLTPIDFLKCDIEGAEYSLFDGDLAWTSSIRRMAIEYHGSWSQGERLGARLVTAGFAVRQTPHGSLGYLHCHRTT